MDRFKVVYCGRVLDGFEGDQVKSAFGQLFSVNGDRLERSFDGRMVDVSRNIPREKADRLACSLQRLGMDVIVTPDEALA